MRALTGFVWRADSAVPEIVLAEGESLDLGIDYSRLLDDGESIAQSTWLLPTALAPGFATVLGTVAVQWVDLGGGAPGRYAVRHTAITDGGPVGRPRTHVRHFDLVLVERR